MPGGAQACLGEARGKEGERGGKRGEEKTEVQACRRGEREGGLRWDEGEWGGGWDEGGWGWVGVGTCVTWTAWRTRGATDRR